MDALSSNVHQPPSPSLAIRCEEFGEWIETAEPGQRIEYHRGHLVIDRVRATSPFGARRWRELNAIAERAMALAAEGRLLLVQERHGDGDYSYVAVKPGRRPATRGARP